jgi:hypothetical protein
MAGLDPAIHDLKGGRKAALFAICFSSPSLKTTVRPIARVIAVPHAAEMAGIGIRRIEFA